MAKSNSWFKEPKFKVPKLARLPKEDNLSIAIKSPVQRKVKFPTIKFKI